MDRDYGIRSVAEIVVQQGPLEMVKALFNMPNFFDLRTAKNWVMSPHAVAAKIDAHPLHTSLASTQSVTKLVQTSGPERSSSAFVVTAFSGKRRP